MGKPVLPDPLPDHPRLLARREDWGELRSRIDTDVNARLMWHAIQQRADAICETAPLERAMDGRMLLMVSREALERISVLALADRIGDELRYGERAVRELVAICRFDDWNPGHFLDVGELCLAVAIGYDWLHDRLDAVTRSEIAKALVAKGIAPSLDTTAAGNWWLETDENWSQVCHGGLCAAAIAIADIEPELSEQIIARALKALPKVAARYAPDGAYPEGPMYWSYGTAYHVVLAAALQRLTGETLGIDTYPGFRESADYIDAVTAPSGDYFNYADCAARRRLQAQLFWMAAKYDRPDLLIHDLAHLATDLEEYLAAPSVQYWYYDMVALALLWHRPAEVGHQPREGGWVGQGPMPVATFRWGARYLAVKGGSVGLSHSHMDLGSFVFESAGVRWLVDAGMQDYAGLEAVGVDIWNEREQTSQRWQVFRIGPDSHNVPRFGGADQQLFKAACLSADEESCTVDLSPAYSNMVTSARRHFRINEDGFVLTDEWVARSKVPMTSQWLTFADVTIQGSAAVLRQNNRLLSIFFEATEGVHIDVEDLSQPRRSFDAPNPGLKRIVVATASAAGCVRATIADAGIAARSH